MKRIMNLYTTCSLYIFLFLAVCFSPADAKIEKNTQPITAWPILYHVEDQNSGTTDVIWPIYHHEWKDSWERYAIRPFLFSTEDDAKKSYRKTSVLWPLSTYKKEDKDTSFYLFPFIWYGDTPEYHYNNIFPVYWDGEGLDYSYFHIWPLFGTNRRGNYYEYSTLYPLFRFGKDPAAGETKIHAPWPIINVHKKKDYLSSSVLPLYWREKGIDYSGGFLFPYYWRNIPDHSAKGILPLWYSSEGPNTETDLFFPFYYNYETADSHLRFITPLYASWEKDNTIFKTFLPLYYYYQTDAFGLKTWLPIYGRYWNGPFSFSTIFPFYYHYGDSEDDTAFSYYLPFYGSYKRGDNISRHFLLFPLYSKYEDPSLQLRYWDVLWPLFYYETSPKTLSIRALPLYWHTRKPEYTFTMGFPLYFSYATEEASYQHFIPFYGEHTKGDWYRKQFVLGPVFMYTKDDHASISRQDFIYPLFSRQQGDGWKRSWAFPFYYHEDDDSSSFTLGSLALLPPYYVNSSDGENERLHIWPFFGKNERGSYKEYSCVWPLIRFGRDDQTDYSMNHLLLFYNKNDKEDNMATFFPLWWHRTEPDKTVDGSLFVHWYERDEGKDIGSLSFLWLWPDTLSLSRYEYEPEYVQHFFFPFYKYEKNDKNDALSWYFPWLLPMNADKTELGRQTDYLWKVISYEKQDVNTKEFRFLWRLIRRKKTADSYALEFNPFYYHVSEKDKGDYWAVLGGLIGKETKPDGKKSMRFLWVF